MGKAFEDRSFAGMTSELLATIEYIEREKNIDREVLREALRTALLSACRKTFPNYEEFEIEIDPATFRIRVLEKGEEVHHADFGRIAAQTAKQVIIQKIREAERDSIYNEFSHKGGEIITGVVHTVERKAIIVDLGKTEAILPAREQAPKDRYRQGDTIRAYVLEVKMTPRGPEIILSRVHPNLVKKLFELEVPEIHDGIVEIKAVTREAGSRTKIAVLSHDAKVDCVGSCVGMRGSRVKNIVNELGGEKIDIVRWSPDQETFIRNALSPAELGHIKLYPSEQRADITASDDQLPLAIGKREQNVRLASRLTGWSLEIRSLSQKIPIAELDGVGEKIDTALKEAGWATIKDLLKATPEELCKVPGIGPKTAERIIASAQRAILQQGNSTPRKESTGER
jgi:N utilization substance protein A